MSKFKICVLGSQGQLGLSIKKIAHEFPEIDFAFMDRSDIDLLSKDSIVAFFNKNVFSFVINCAAYTLVDQAENDIESAQRVNTVAVETLANVLQRYNTFLIHISTDYVFDGKSNQPYVESDKPNPQNVYGFTKLKGEQAIQKSMSDYLIIRTSWLYSEFRQNFVKTMLRLASERAELRVVTDQYGSPTYAVDLARAILMIITRIKSEPLRKFCGVYHYSNEGRCSWYEFAKQIFELNGSKIKIIPVLSCEYPTLAKRPLFSLLSKEKVKNDFHLQIPFWKDSLRVCLESIGSGD